MGFNAGKNGSQQHTNEGEEGRDRASLRKSIERSRQRAEEADDGANGTEANSANGMSYAMLAWLVIPNAVILTRHGIQITTDRENVKSLKSA